jgi:hypothetical protein
VWFRRYSRRRVNRARARRDRRRERVRASPTGRTRDVSAASCRSCRGRPRRCRPGPGWWRPPGKARTPARRIPACRAKAARVGPCLSSSMTEAIPDLSDSQVISREKLKPTTSSDKWAPYNPNMLLSESPSSRRDISVASPDELDRARPMPIRRRHLATPVACLFMLCGPRASGSLFIMSARDPSASLRTGACGPEDHAAPLKWRAPAPWRRRSGATPVPAGGRRAFADGDPFARYAPKQL